MKISILTYHAVFNYGAMLQAFATQKVLERLGHDVEFIDFYPKDTEKENHCRQLSLSYKTILVYFYSRINPKIQMKFKRFNAFRSQMNLTKRYYSVKEIYQNPPISEAYIVGSDQVWNCERGIDSFYFLDFLKRNNNKISFASSFGTSQIPRKYYFELKELLSDFKAISIREDDGVRIIKEATGRIPVQVLDPTLLLKKNEWQNYIKGKNVQGDYILIYELNKSIESLSLLEAVRKRYKITVVGVPVGVKVPSEFNVDKEIIDAGPIEFINLFYHAKVICTSSFHGLAFAINFEKTFYIVPHPNRNSRLNSLLKALKLLNRQTYSAANILNINDSEIFMDYTETRCLLNGLREKSINFLKKNI